MNESPYFKFGEQVKLENPDKLFTITRTKHCTYSNGIQVWYFMLADEQGSPYREDTEAWFASDRLKKVYEPSTLTFNELKQLLEEI
jgi:hypothetical protein